MTETASEASDSLPALSVAFAVMELAPGSRVTVFVHEPPAALAAPLSALEPT